MSKLNLIVYYLLLPTLFTLIGWFANTYYHLPRDTGNPIAIIRPTPLARYTIENLENTNIPSVQITIGEKIKDYEKFSSSKFYMNFDPTLSGRETKKVSGVINIPSGVGPFPVIVMFRGFADPEIYYMGIGTQPSASVFASNGYITLAPDFLGYGESDREAEDIFEARFQTYTTALTLLKSIDALKEAPLKVGSDNIRIDTENIFIWGHSNGGQIALTVLEITEESYPAVLWAPVSKPFPFSILYYTDEATDAGKFLRRETAKFENDYDSDMYSLTSYFDKIKAPVQLNQGTIDDAVPLSWSSLLEKKLTESGVDVSFIKYPGADHNMRPSWNSVVENNLQFFKKYLK